MNGTIERVHVKNEKRGERGIPKVSVPSAEVVTAGVVGDFNRYRTKDKGGDLDMAVLLLPAEVLEALRGEGWPVEPGHLGENFLTRGLPNDAFAVGQRYRLGTDVELQISRVCDPCSNLRVLPYVGREKLKEFLKATLGRRGFYARVRAPGVVRTGDPIALQR
ncbi:MAG: MOSC domain-containing protein [Polyangiales bacterium]